MTPESRNPTTGKVAGFREIIEVQGSKFDTPEDSGSLRTRQASRIRGRFPVSWSMARVVAELHYGARAAA